MNSFRLFAAVLLVLSSIVSSLVHAADIQVKPVQFARGASSATIKGSIKGYQTIDYTVQAGAGQMLTATLKTSKGANYFNVLPPGSPAFAMYMGDTSGNHFEGLLPDDGVYKLRVYLMRSAARRNETANYTLELAITGQPLKPLPPSVDAKVPGTPYHATTTVPCVPAYSEVRECTAGVIRRSHDGTATVVLSWPTPGGLATRRILFVKGEPKVADTPQPMKFSRSDRGEHVVSFGSDERFEIPEALVSGG